MEPWKAYTRMLYPQDLRQLVSSFLVGRTSFDSFADNYRHISRVKFGASPDVLKACLDIDAALSMVYFDDATEIEFREELEKAIRHFVSQRVYARPVRIVVGTPQFTATSTSSSVPEPFEVAAET